MCFTNILNTFEQFEVLNVKVSVFYKKSAWFGFKKSECSNMHGVKVKIQLICSWKA
jgi:hypothetical protein